VEVIGDLPVVVGAAAAAASAAASAAVGLFAKRRPIFTRGNFGDLNKPSDENRVCQDPVGGYFGGFVRSRNA